MVGKFLRFRFFFVAHRLRSHPPPLRKELNALTSDGRSALHEASSLGAAEVAVGGGPLKNGDYEDL